MFDFAAALAQAENDAKSTALEALVLGPSGAGKSSVAGTFNVPTLYLYSAGENHGVKAARACGGMKVTPVCFDQNATPDQALENLLSVLKNVELIKQHGFKAVVVDGASELETLIRASKAWAKACQTSKGSHNAFEEPKATIAGFRPIITALKDLQRLTGVHYVMTCILDVKEMSGNGAYVEAMPRLQGYSVAESLVQQFGDVLVVGKMTNPQGKVGYRLQFMTDLTKTSKDEAGSVKRMLNFAPRISGLKLTDLPPHMEANLAEVVALKEKAFGGSV